MSHVHTKSGIFMSVMPGARMLRIVVMMLIEPMIDEAPRMWTARIVMSTDMPCWIDERRIERPARGGGAARREERAHQQDRRRDQQPEAPVVHARERHVGRAHLHRHQPVREAHEGRHDRAEHHHQAVHGGERVEELRVEELQARLEELGADAAAPSCRPRRTSCTRTRGTSCRCPCGWSCTSSA